MSTGMCPFNHSVSADAAAFDPFGEAYLADPPTSLRWSRDEEPVFYSPEIGYWVVTRYDDVKAVFRDNILFSPSVALEKITPVCEEANAILAQYGYAMDRTLVNEDEPAHMPRRRALLDPFTPRQLAHHEPRARELTRAYVDRFVDAGKVDLVDAMLWEVPLTVALHFLGVPEEDMDTLRRYSIAHTVNTWGRPTREEQVAVAEAVGKFWQYAGEVVEKLKRDPSGPGWMPYSIRAQREQPDVITDSYLHSIMMAIVVAAHETTANAAANAIKLLLENRATWEELCRQPSLLPNAVEECLRHSGSVAAWRRLVTEDTTIGGVPIPKGARLLIVNSSANRDERHFEEPDTFDIRRENATDHLTFGYGSHQCLGKNLARMEIQIFLQELTTRLPHLELVPDQRFTYLPNTSFRGPDHLWVQWDPTANPERTDPSILHRRYPVTIGEPSTRSLTRTVTVRSVDQVADGVVVLTLAEPSGSPLPAWSPGAHIALDLDGLSRHYSLCSDPDDRSRYTIAVLREPESRGGSRYLHDKVRVGQNLVMRGPRNHFRLDTEAGRYVFVAGGIGITPIIAMADHVRRRGLPYEIHYCGRSRSTMAWLDRLRQDHGEQLTLHVSGEGNRLDVAGLLAEPTEGTRIYACGPERLLTEVERATGHWPNDAVRVERFTTGHAVLDPAVEREFEVELADSKLTVRVPADQTVLAALRAANIDVPSDCEEGLCGTCEIPVLAGQVDHRDVVLTKTERAANTKMMTCCSRAHDGKLTLGL